MKTCSCCNIEKPFEAFYKDKKTRDGLYSRCKVCHGASTDAWRRDNRASVNESARKSRARNIETVRERSRLANRAAYQNDPEKFRLMSAEYRKLNPDKAAKSIREARAKKPDYMPAYLADYYQKHKEAIKASVRERERKLGDALKPVNAEKAMRRIARKRCATPAWANREAILAFYDEAARKSALTGVKHDVDHVVPLQSKRVCGLHVEHNLRVIPHYENQSKSNRWWPDSP